MNHSTPDSSLPESDGARLEDAIDRFVREEGSDGVRELNEALGVLRAEERSIVLTAGVRLDDLQLIRPLGRGGMGHVWEASQESVPGRRVAVKVLASAALASPRFRSRFDQEVEAMARLQHANIVAIYASGEWSGRPYLVMPFIVGTDMGRLIADLRRHGPPRTLRGVRQTIAAAVDESKKDWESHDHGALESSTPYERWAACVARDVADALQHACGLGITHRVVKPGNVLLDTTGRPFLADFGLARISDQPTITDDGQFVGTIAYAAPEQIAGKPADTRADVFSLGAVLFELLTLRAPFAGNTRHEIERSIGGPQRPELPRSVPADLRTIVGRALEVDPKQRFEEPGEMAAELQRFLSGQTIRTRPPGPARRLARAIRTRPRLAVGALVIALAIGTFFIKSRWAWQREHLAGMVSACEVAFDRLRESTIALGHTRVDLRRTEPQLAEARSEFESHRQRFHTLASTAQEMGVPFANDGRAYPTLAKLAALRIRAALATNLDLLDPPKLRECDELLRRFDTAGTYADLLDTHTVVSLRTRRPGVQVQLKRIDHPEWSAPNETGPTSTNESKWTLPEGSFIATLSLDGFMTARLPFAVRRPACFERPGDRQRFHDLEVELRPAAENESEWVHIPGGWSLLGESAVRWHRFRPFMIQRHEVSAREWSQFLNRYAAELRKRKVELHRLIGTTFGMGVPIISKNAEGQFVPYPFYENKSMALVRRDDSAFYANWKTTLYNDESWVKLPNEMQWERAFRGADGRRYPTGNRLPQSFPCESPFGVVGMAGGYAEYTCTRWGRSQHHHVIRGGSFESPPTARTATSWRVDPHVRMHDVGFRMTRQWSSPELERVSLPFDTNFGTEAAKAPRADSLPVMIEPPNGESIGGGWRAHYSGDSHRDWPLLQSGERVAIEDGSLYLRGGEGNYSQSVTVSIGMERPQRDLSVQATALVQVGTDPWPIEKHRRTFIISVAEDQKGSAFVSLCVRPGATPYLVIRSTGGGNERFDPPAGRKLAKGPWRVELRVQNGHVEARVWPADAEPIVEPTIKAPLPADMPEFSVLSMLAGNLEAISARVSDLSIKPLQ